MGAYIGRRLFLFLPSVFVVSVIIFLVMQLFPGDVALLILAGDGNAEVDPQLYAELREELGLNRPVLWQYGSWLIGLASLNPGDSLYSGRPIFTEIADSLPVTFELAVLSTIISLVVAIPTGLLAAARQNTPWDYGIRLFAISGLSMPPFFTGSLVILGLIIFFRWIPPLEYASFLSNPTNNLQQMIFPAAVLGFAHAALLSRMTRSSMLEVMRQDYVRTAWAKGLVPRVVLVRHALRNALIPILTVAGIQFGGMFAGSVVLEGIFVLPGVGLLLVDSILNRDWPMVQTLVTLFALVFLVINLLVDVMYGWLDPRVRLST